MHVDLGTDCKKNELLPPPKKKKKIPFQRHTFSLSRLLAVGKNPPPKFPIISNIFLPKGHLVRVYIHIKKPVPTSPTLICPYGLYQQHSLGFPYPKNIVSMAFVNIAFLVSSWH